MSTEPWILAIDFGTSYTVAASRVGDRSPEIIEIDGERRTPSVLLLDPSDDLIVGRPAEDLSSTNPGRVLRAPKSRLGEPAPVVLGGRAFAISDLVADLLRSVYDAAVRYHGRPPTEVRLTHPATWSGPRRQQLAAAAHAAGIVDPVLVPEPVAAAIAYADEMAVPIGRHVLVYDLGGGTFDTAALQRSPTGFVVLGRPNGDQRLGGELFDDLLTQVIGGRLEPGVWQQVQLADDPQWVQAAMALRREARRVKEALSGHPRAEAVVALPTGLAQVSVSRDDLEGVIGPYVREAVDVMHQTASAAGLTPEDLAAIYLVGGASRTPLVERLVRERYPTVDVSMRGDPKGVVAIGATHPLATPTSLAQRSSLDRATSIDQPLTSPKIGAVTALDGPPTVVDGGTVLESGSVVTDPAAPARGIGSSTAVSTDEFTARRRRWIAGGAVAAAVVLIAGALALSSGGDGSENESDSAAVDDTRRPSPGPVTIPPAVTDAVEPDPPTIAVERTDPPETNPPVTDPPGPDPADAPVGPPDAATLQAAVLNADDLSEGWTPLTSEQLADETPFCAVVPEAGRVAEQLSGFERLEAGIYRTIGSSVTVYDSPSSAQLWFDRSVESLTNCAASTVDVGGFVYALAIEVQVFTPEELATLPCGDQAALVVAALVNPNAPIPSVTQVSQAVRCGTNVSEFQAAGWSDVASASATLLDTDYLAGTTATLTRLVALPGST